MQHWHIYIKWNERFFHEMYLAYKQGRIDKDPSESWYAGEIGFFDFYSEYIYQAMSMDPSWCSVLCNTAISSLLFCCAHLDWTVIPLAKKLFTCGVFGVQSDEFLNYAIINRKEWEAKGEEMVAQYKKNFKSLYDGGDETEYEDVTERADDLDILRGMKNLLEV